MKFSRGIPRTIKNVLIEFNMIIYGNRKNIYLYKSPRLILLTNSEKRLTFDVGDTCKYTDIMKIGSKIIKFTHNKGKKTIIEEQKILFYLDVRMLMMCETGVVIE